MLPAASSTSSSSQADTNQRHSQASSTTSSTSHHQSPDPKTILDEKLHVVVDHLAQRLQHALVHVWALFCLAALKLRSLMPVVASAVGQQAAKLFTAAFPQARRQQLQATLAEVPDGFWAKLHWVWELPMVRSIRITLSVANWGVRLPAIMALLFTQGSIIASQVGAAGARSPAAVCLPDAAVTCCAGVTWC